MKIDKFFNLFAFFLLWSTLFAKESPPQARPESQKQIIRIGNSAEPKVLDPALATGAIEAHIIDNLFEGLTTIDPYTGEPLPGAASSWTISPDGLNYTFTLRKNLCWSDGTKLTAEDFRWAWVRALEPKTASEYGYQLYPVKNAEAFNKGELKDPFQLGIHVVDTQTLNVNLEHPTPYFLRLTAFQTLYPTPKHLISKNNNWTDATRMVSNGPFKLAEWSINKHIKLVSNPYYWDKDQVKLKEAYFLPIENGDTEEKNFLSGDLDITSTVPALRLQHYRTQQKDKLANVWNPLKTNPFLAVYFYRLNVTKPPLNNIKVRKALAMTIDRKLLVERVTRGGQIPYTAFTPPIDTYSTPGKLDISPSAKTIEAAQKLLAEAGYPNGQGMPPLDILYFNNEDEKKIAIAIQQMWNKSLHINVGLFNQEWKVYLDRQLKLDYTIARSRWIGDYPDPNTFLDMFVTNGGNNQTGWSNKDYDHLIRQAALEPDPHKRNELFQKNENILLEELPVIPIFIFTNIRLIAPYVQMFKPGTHDITEWKSDIMDRIFLKYYVITNRK
ncbi:MAG: peptide ABC transporter substrate-binding protein [Oligoflexales bacterium]|nr:peptide ABC transporter substrate-binding protein [Oligoflexales bacterium]